MAFARGKFGIEWDATPPQDPDGSWLPLVLGTIAVIAVISLTWTLVVRYRASREDAHYAEVAAQGGDGALAVENHPKPVPAGGVSAAAERTKPSPARGGADAAAPVSLPPAVPTAEVRQRPTVVQNLLLRLNAAEKRGDVELAATTIETLRGFPAAADLEDKLSRRLGELNMRRLFELKSARWVAEVTVRRGDAAERLARENGSTLASLIRLNGCDPAKIRIGQTLKVMNHPRFNLVVHRRARMADLFLNGRFFKRYDLVRDVTGAPGSFEIADRLRPFWSEHGLVFGTGDRDELEMLLPRGTTVNISEL